MKRDKSLFRHVLLHYFDLNRTAAEAHLVSETYGEQAPSKAECLENKPKKFDDAELQALLDENPAQTLKELSEALNVTPVSERLHAMGKIQKNGKWIPKQ